MAQTPERHAYLREYYARNRERLAEKDRAWRAKNREYQRAYNAEYHAANRRSQMARQRADRHGMQPEDWAALWEAQGGRCYLCGKPLSLANRGVHIDHDHSCCPIGESCKICRRGLACNTCNVAIGMAADDPDQLRRMADALEAAQLLVGQRKAEAGERLTLF